MYALVCFLLVVFAWDESSAEPDERVKKLASIIAARYVAAEEYTNNPVYYAEGVPEDFGYLFPENDIPLLYLEKTKDNILISRSIALLTVDKEGMLKAELYTINKNWNASGNYSQMRNYHVLHQPNCDKRFFAIEDDVFSFIWNGCSRCASNPTFLRGEFRCKEENVVFIHGTSNWRYTRELSYELPPNLRPSQPPCSLNFE
ncbi:uncharacterized protein LOC106061828 [Biomphalaria glabrata]|uniref:Uncharacterized protein LOC106061828 n=1 Tax=Biomphalaria glabrata TaxID=6526 RepID=A0A9W3BFI7_BIOGL|nr:uncharacterized protein LOC106061828 [Biomphalaria glabrata]KAI8748896.1 hypothetical protein BgiMline_018328 [Biomphalaria glabrata]